jgi:hypothetical protein
MQECNIDQVCYQKLPFLILFDLSDKDDIMAKHCYLIYLELCFLARLKVAREVRGNANLVAREVRGNANFAVPKPVASLPSETEHRIDGAR